MQKIHVILITLLNLAFTGALSTYSVVTETFVTEEVEEYDEKLTEFLREIIENFRSQMHEGIVDVGIPPLDPLSIPNISEDIDENIAQMVLRMRDLNITGISDFDLKVLKADLHRGFINVSLTVPELKADGYCFMNGRLLKIFPINSDGPFCIRVSEVSIDGHGNLNVSTDGETRIHMNDLRLNLTFGDLEARFDSLLGGGKWTQTLLKMLTAIGPKLFRRFNQPIMNAINNSLLTLVNEELDKGTLKDILDLIPKQ